MAPVLLLCGACATPTQYYWGSYENDLLQAYKNPEAVADFQQTLLTIIETSDEKGQKVPPGICGEYGYGLYKAGKIEQAAVYFEREKKEWPESAVLMDTLIRNMRRLEEDSS